MTLRPPRLFDAPAPRSAGAFRAAFALSCALCALVLVPGFPLVYPRLQASTPLVEDRRGAYLTEDLRGSRDLGFWLASPEDNPFLADALVSVEDTRFRSHPGVDPRALVRAALATLGGERQGASTIAMQTVRLSYPGQRGLGRKIAEASAAFTATALYGRDFILSRYLSELPQGNRIFGVSYAARRYFRKPLSDLSGAECALLAALPQAPGQMNPFDPEGFRRAKARARLVLDRMAASGRLDAEGLALDRAELDALPRPRRESRPGDSLHFIERTLEAASGPAAAGLRAPLRSTLDPELQAFAAETAARMAAENGRLGATEAAVVVVQVPRGEVRAWAGSASYFDQDRAGSIDYALAPRSSGSALKPFLYALGLDSGAFTPGSVLADLPFAVLSPTGEYRAANFDDDYLGPLLYGRALANSRNIPALRVLERVGGERFLDLCRSLGLSATKKDASWYGYGLAIGGLEVSLADLCAAYAVLAADGRRTELRFFEAGALERAVGSASRPSAGVGGPRDAPLSAAASRSVLRWLSDPQARAPSFPRLGALEYAWPVAVKTGTSQGFRDAWAVAVSRDWVVGAWMGNPDAKPMNRVAGLTAAAYVHRVMERLQPLQAEGIDERLFPLPEGAEGVDVCPLSGALAGPDCPSRVREYFSADTLPRDPCPVHRRIPVDSATGAPADQRTPASRVALRSATVLPPEYALWGSRRGLSAPAAGGTVQSSVSIVSPADGARLVADPDTDERFRSVGLEARVLPQTDTLSWFANGKLLARVGYPHAARLPLKSGRWEIEAVSSSGGRSRKVVVEVP